MFKQTIEEERILTQKKLKEIMFGLEKLDRDYQQLLNDLNMTPELISEYVRQKETSQCPIWEDLKKEKAELDAKLQLDLSQIKDVANAEKKVKDLGHVQQHWLHVR